MGERITDQALAAELWDEAEKGGGPYGNDARNRAAVTYADMNTGGREAWDRIAVRARRVLAREREYNGWPNYETWAVNLWITNDHASYDAARGLVRDTLEQPCDFGRGVPVSECKGGWIGGGDKRRGPKGADKGPGYRKCPVCDGTGKAPMFKAADALKEWVDSHMIPDLGASMAADLLGAALAEVDWQRIAESLSE